MEVEPLVVLTTVATPEAAAQLARRLVEERLAGCVQVIPGGTAIYRWQGALFEEPQSQLLIKATTAVWEQLRARIIELHADAVPEILALPVTDGLPAYLAWLRESTEP